MMKEPAPSRIIAFRRLYSTRSQAKVEGDRGMDASVIGPGLKKILCKCANIKQLVSGGVKTQLIDLLLSVYSAQQLDSQNGKVSVGNLIVAEVYFKERLE